MLTVREAAEYFGRRLAGENRFYEWNDLVTIQSKDGAFMCQATPKGSYGEYLYIGCWEA